MKKLALAVVLVAISVAPQSVHASDVFLIRFDALGKSNALFVTRWRDDVLFFNGNVTPVEVRFVGVSNGTPQATTPPLTIPAGAVGSLNANQTVEASWRPVGGPSLWLLHLDVPPGVVVESRDEFFADSLVAFPSASPAGKVSMPVFRQLAPANARQVILGTDLMAYTSRINVGIYNGGEQTASASIEIRRVTDNSIVDTRSITVAGNTLVQVGGFSVGPAEPPINYQLYTVVKVSEPSLVYVANLNDTVTLPGTEQGLFPIVGLAVAINQSF